MVGAANSLFAGDFVKDKELRSGVRLEDEHVGKRPRRIADIHM